MNKKDVYVIKRDGSHVPYDVQKIKKSVQFATDGQGVNPLQLEASLDQVIKNGVKTSAIQENIIRHALQLASPQDPKWVNVAGRALAMQQWADFKLRGKSFYEIVQYNIRKGEYTKELNEFYSKDDIDSLGSYISLDRDLEHSHSSLITVQKKYLGKYELNQHMHMVTAMRFGQLEAPENRLEFVRKLYDYLSLRKISLATPFMANLRRGGNVSSCFIIGIGDDLDSIFDNVKRMAKISKNGGGLGVYLGYIRAMGSDVGHAKNAAGTIVQWVKIMNDTMVAVNQSFTGDVLVETSAGDVRIDNVKSGDLVKTHDGSLREVLAVKSNFPDTPSYKIETSLGVVRATQGHPVLAVKHNNLDLNVLKQKLINSELAPVWVDVGDLTPEWVVIKSR